MLKYKARLEAVDNPTTSRALEDVKYVAKLEEQKLADKANHKEALDWQRRIYECQLAHRDQHIQKLEHNLREALKKDGRADEPQPQDLSKAEGAEDD